MAGAVIGDRPPVSARIRASRTHLPRHVRPGLEMNAIEINNLKYRYRDGTEALRGVSFRVLPGECVALLGPNGSGKSTLLLHLNGILPETFSNNGAVKIFGEAISQKNLESVRREVGLVFQDPDDQL